ncbi:MAG: flagellar hook capping FlgD N-terminal domain-containing protein [Phycisphaerales bacterium JB054]
MTVNAVDAIGSSASTQSSAVSGLSSDEFFQLIFAELSNQDPLEPNDTNALLEQIANIRSIQSDDDLSKRLTDLVGQNELASGAGLIGKLISGLSETSQRVSGLVQSVSKTDEGVVLNLAGGTRVPMASVDQVLQDQQDDETDDSGADS